MQLSKFSIASKKYWSTAQQKSDKCKKCHVFTSVIRGIRVESVGVWAWQDAACCGA